MTLLTIDNSNLVINNESNCVNDYYEYIVLLIQNIIHKNKLSVNIILNNNNFKLMFIVVLISCVLSALMAIGANNDTKCK